METGLKRGVSRAPNSIVSTTRRIEGAGGKMYSFWAMYSLRMSFCRVPEMRFHSAPWRSAATRNIAQITAAGELMVIAVVAHQRGKVESDREAGLALGEQEAVAFVGFFRGGEAGELAHGPELAAVAGGVDAAHIRCCAGGAHVAVEIEVRGQIRRGVERVHRHAAEGGEIVRALGAGPRAVKIGAGGHPTCSLGGGRCAGKQPGGREQQVSGRRRRRGAG